MSMEVIDSGTLVPIGLIIMLSGSVIGGVVWLTNLHSLTKENAKRIGELETDMDGKITELKTEVNASRELHVKNGERLVKIEAGIADLPAIKQSLIDLNIQLAKMFGEKDKK